MKHVFKKKITINYTPHKNVELAFGINVKRGEKIISEFVEDTRREAIKYLSDDVVVDLEILQSVSLNVFVKKILDDSIDINFVLALGFENLLELAGHFCQQLEGDVSK